MNDSRLIADSAPSASSRDGAALRAEWAPVLSMLAATLVGALLPLVQNPSFYLWDDTEAAAVGVWHRIPQDLLSGALPFLQLDMWRGGNLIAEAATGMWNPVMLALMTLTSPIDDVAVGITIAKLALLLAMASGVYALSREYGARPWMAALAGMTLPLSGWVLHMDGTSWINGTAIAAFIPWAWFALRRCVRRGLRPADFAVAAILCTLPPSTGNPYGVLAIAVVLLAVVAEAFATGRRRAVWSVAAIGAATALASIVVYLPFILTSAYGVRAETGVGNDEFLSMTLNALIGLSAPTLLPYITMFGGTPMTFPGAYLGWFVLPLLPWLRWSVVRSQWRRLCGVLVFGSIFLLLVLGPSQLGMFRWPARLVPFLYLAVIVLFAVVASRGLHSGRRALRMSVSAGLIVLGVWMSVSDSPAVWRWHAVVTILIAALTAAAVLWARAEGARGFAVMAGGLLLLLVPQLLLSPGNQNVAHYGMPTSQSDLRSQFADRADGLVVQVFDVQQLVDRFPIDERWDDLLAGNMPAVAEFESTTAYSGIGFTAFDSALCLTYNGATCPGAWDALLQAPPGSVEPLADLLAAKYIVVQRDFADDVAAPAGWAAVERTPVVTVYERIGETPHPLGTISVAGRDVTVTDDRLTGPVGETAQVSTGQGGATSVTFARIAWPGYSAGVDGRRIPVRTGPAGLLTVDLPQGLQDARLTVTFVPPGLLPGVIALGGAIALIVVIVLASAVRRRHRSRPASRSFGLGAGD